MRISDKTLQKILTKVLLEALINKPTILLTKELAIIVASNT